ncbi:MAG TPA: hypothetical protein VJW96_09190 [Terriglobales bacterium]|nr:hypothetical protein [Terriglobales bacterium]
MNPLASYKCAGRLLVALAAMTSILLIAGCGSSSSGPALNTVGFTNASLTGTYVFSSSGVDSSSGAPINMAGAFAAEGNGRIAGGAMDIVDPTVAVETNQAIGTSSSYKVNGDGRGQVTLVTPVGTFALDFVLTSSSHGLVTEFDGNGTGSGTLDLQTALTGQSQLAGSYAFTLGGFDGVGNPFASAGAFRLDQSGNITAGTGVQDFNDNGSLISDLSVAGTAIVSAGSAPGTITLTSSSQIFDFYPIDATHFKVIETDNTDFLAGDVFSQPSASLPTGAMVFAMSGGAFSVIADAGVMTYDGTTFSGSEDLNSNGTLFPGVVFTSTAVTAGPVGGRAVVSLSGFNPASTWVVYPSSGGLLMLEADALDVTLGAALTQTPGQTIAASQNYGLNLSAFNTAGFEENDIAQFLTTSSTFSGVVDINDDSGSGNIVQTSQSLKGNYTLNFSGTGAATTTANGTAYVSFNFYPVSSDMLFLLETDSNQIGAGIIQLQSTPSGSVAQSRISLARPAVLRSAVRSRLAARRK